MSASLHCIIQIKTQDIHGTDIWVDAIKNSLDLWTSAVRKFFDDTQDIITPGFPNGFVVDQNNYHDQMYMGDYGFGVISGEDFLDLDYEPKEVRSLKQEIQPDKVVVTFYLKPGAEYDDEGGYCEDMAYEGAMRSVQNSICTILGCEKEEFRLIVGFS